MNIKSITYTNAVIYKYHNSRLYLNILGDSDIFIVTKTLIKCKSKKELNKLKKYNSKTTNIEIGRNSLNAIWINRIRLSMTAMACLHDSLYKLKEIINLDKKIIN